MVVDNSVGTSDSVQPPGVTGAVITSNVTPNSAIIEWAGYGSIWQITVWEDSSNYHRVELLDMEEENADSMCSSEPSGFKYEMRGLRPGQSYKVTVAPWTIGRLTQSGTDASENTSFTTPG